MERPWLVKKLEGLGNQTVRGGCATLALAVFHQYSGRPQMAWWMFAAGIAMFPLGFLFAGLDFCCQALVKHHKSE